VGGGCKRVKRVVDEKLEVCRRDMGRDFYYNKQKQM